MLPRRITSTLRPLLSVRSFQTTSTPRCRLCELHSTSPHFKFSDKKTNWLNSSTIKRMESTQSQTTTSSFSSYSQSAYEADVKLALKKMYIRLINSEDNEIDPVRNRKQYGSKFLTRVASFGLDEDENLAQVPFDDARQILKGLLTVHNVELDEETVSLVERILRFENGRKSLTSLADIPNRNALPDLPNIKIGIWRGDITTLEVDAIVNAANEQMKGCFVPFHSCIDNVIHDRAGPKLRRDCHDIMEEQGHLEATGVAKITPAYCLPSKFVLHTVGPIIEEDGPLKPDLLSSSYRECLNLAEAKGLQSVAFCCISTGVFGYPKLEAAHVALATVRDWMKDHNVGGKASSVSAIIFNVFTKEDTEIYQEIVGDYFEPKSNL